ncbi:hypothetical protein D6D21_10545 [Aureobasidium pullulans]|uniref:Fe2OG dioxygenase domain-containing protein n=1 Tax=Aureobasidium pullulans TaxID=5580 RepID=A0AB74IHX0_AURPU|nr:hypothetical protein D6D21_10545 [Aureobasidium pullulans]
MSATRLGFLLLGGVLLGLLSSRIIQQCQSFPVLWSSNIFYGKQTQLSQAATHIGSSRVDDHRVSIVSVDPLVLYIQNFVTAEEASSLIKLVEGSFKPSEIWSNDGNEGKVVKEVRDSNWASPNTSEPIVQTIRARAKSFQGFDNAGDVEPLKVLKYEIGGHYNHHHDSFPEEVAKHSMQGNRLSTFFVYLAADCTGGGTNFPDLKRPRGVEWCEFIDCEEPMEKGVTFKPIAGNAIYWYNLIPRSETPHPALRHAGMPVISGKKIGLNMWTWTPYPEAA